MINIKLASFQSERKISIKNIKFYQKKTFEFWKLASFVIINLN